MKFDPWSTGAQLAELATRGRQRGTVLVTGAVGNVGRSAVFTAKESGWSVVAGVRNKRMQEAKTTGADRVIALDDQASLKSLEPVDAIADTISGSIADQLIGKVQNGGVFALCACAAEQHGGSSGRKGRDHAGETGARHFGTYGRSGPANW